ncbi:hypothetical protein LCGC14_0735250 [marine sediment metagenome]|uniref:Uncharacterized protein n=1 Tax=marine sediment metagenome TaxID=412755 RepID=A0A0F9Q8C9_9ZZZZ
MQEYPRLISIRVVNFQIIVDSTLELGNLTVLCGAGDVGKSAFLRAIRAVCLNDAVDEDIRHGTKQTEVTLTFEDGTEIIWSKALKKGGCYRMGDTEYNKCNGQVPEAIAEYLGIGSIEVDSTTTLTPQLSDQHDLPFIIMETGSKRARILGKATRLDLVITAQMQCKKELDQTRRAATEAATSLTIVEEQLEAIPDYKDIENDLNGVEGDIKTLQESLERADQAENLVDRIEEAHSRATALDVAPLYAKLDVAAESLDRAECLQCLAKRIPELTKEMEDRGKRVGDHKEALESFQEQLTATCIEAGICEACNGLLSHEECTG